MSRLNAISLFSGAGGMDIGLENAGLELAACAELDPVRCKTLRENRPRWRVLCADVRSLSGEDLLSVCSASSVDLVAAGPPCQPFSKSAYWITEGKVRDTEGAQLMFQPVRVAQELDARAVLIENVPGLKYRHARPLLDLLLKRLSQAGYSTTYGVLDAADYGAPQHRKRLIVLGMKDTDPLLPPPTYGNGRGYISAGRAIGDLDDGQVNEWELIGGKYGHLLQLIPPGQNYIYLTDRGEGEKHFRYRSRYWSFLLKLSPDRPSWTIPARAGPFTGPFHWRSRKLRISELKRLQTIPDSWKICGSEKSARSQVGDAVPPLLAQRIGEQIVRQLRG